MARRAYRFQSSDVILEKCEAYDEPLISNSVRRVFESFPQLREAIKPGQTVLLKPNLLSGRPPAACVTTHPLVVRAVAQEVLELGAQVRIGDSPALGSGTKAALRSGILDGVKDLPVSFCEFRTSRARSAPPGLPFRSLEFAQEVLEVDHVINLPKIKTHAQMIMTLAVKNLFGCVLGVRKQEWHLKAGKSTTYFSEMLVEIGALIQPLFTVVDGVIGMEGNGPNNGTPKPIGLIIGGYDPVAVDRVILECLQLNPKSIMTMNAARKLGIGETDLEKINIRGAPLAECKISNFKLPTLQSLLSNRLPEFVALRLKRIMTEKPVIDYQQCTDCQTCVTVCPPQAVSLQSQSESARVTIDQNLCIHCFCCQETCPDGAISVQSGIGKKVIQRLFA